MNRIESDRIPQTISGLLELRSRLTPRARAFLFHPAPGRADWQPMAWETMQRECLRFAEAFRRAGLTPGTRVALLLGQSVTWELLAHAVYRNRAALIAIEGNTDPSGIGELLRHSEASMVVTDADGWSKLRKTAGNIQRLKTILIGSDLRLDPHDESIFMETLLAQGQSAQGQGDEFDELPLPSPDDLATIVYTSGTTGAPKGIPFRHRQVMVACGALADAYSELGPEDRTICWLPLSALFQRMANLLSMVFGMETYMVDNSKAIFQEIVEAKPTFFIGVPRFYEKLEEALADNAWPDLAQALDKVKLMISGSAPIRVSVLERLGSRGIAVREAYGLSENTVPVALNRLTDYRFGTVGKPLSPNRVKLADDGEVLVKGPGLFSAYLGEPPARERFTVDGYYRTGDLGRFDEDGFLSLIGRKCELIKTSTGRRIAPSRVESAYSACPKVNQIIVVGDGRKYLAALITPTKPWSELNVGSPESLQELQSDLAAAGESLNPYEQVQAFGLLPRAFGPGETTSSQKLCRAVIIENYSDLIERLYAEPPPCILMAGQDFSSRDREQA